MTRLFLMATRAQRTVFGLDSTAKPTVVQTLRTEPRCLIGGASRWLSVSLHVQTSTPTTSLLLSYYTVTTWLLPGNYVVTTPLLPGGNTRDDGHLLAAMTPERSRAEYTHQPPFHPQNPTMPETEPVGCWMLDVRRWMFSVRLHDTIELLPNRRVGVRCRQGVTRGDDIRSQSHPGSIVEVGLVLDAVGLSRK